MAFDNDDIMEVIADEIGDFCSGARRTTMADSGENMNAQQVNVYRRPVSPSLGWPNAEEARPSVRHKETTGGGAACV